MRQSSGARFFLEDGELAVSEVGDLNLLADPLSHLHAIDVGGNNGLLFAKLGP